MMPIKDKNTSDSPNKKALRRLLKNKAAVFGCLVIGVAIIVAILGYTICPDDSPYANEQISAVALANPGYTATLLKIRKNTEVEKNGFIKKLIFGQPNSYRLVPINSYTFRNDSILAVRYAGKNPVTNKPVDGQTLGIPLAEVLYPLSYDEKPVFKNKEVNYTRLSGEKSTAKISTLQKTIIAENIVQNKFILGTDKYGRDMLSRLILGVRISLLTGLIAVIISLTIGIFLGAIAGYLGGKTDDVIMLLINTVWSIPTLLLVFAIVLALGRGIGIIFLAVGLTMWVDVARIVRGQVLAFRKIQFVEAAQVMGFSTGRIILKHIIPNILGPIMVIAAANFATAILIEAGLSYLGFGIQPPNPSWGTMLNENYGYAIGGKPFLALVPALAIMIMVLAFNLIGNGLRDALDVNQ
jgi:ABC-type dipeptide/oligopeptide/nickel transport systems, permease components